MTECERLSDRMPGVALHRSSWTAEEAAHLELCADCRAEWALIQGVRRLEARAPEVDVEAIAAAVEHRLAAEGTARQRRHWIWGASAAAAAAAAAIVIALTGGTQPLPETAPSIAVEAGPLVPLPELEGLETAQLDTLLRALDGSLAGSPTLESTTPSDEADAELERILATWEG